jgi:YebC/PmpR family DNA-binding regulatory protein
MAGHSKWANIKHKKAREDAKRGKIFSKLVKKITSAARRGGGDPDINNELRLFIDKAKDANMPKENIERAIKKGTGELEGVSYDEFTYEGYGPGGVAIFLTGATDNRNRTVAEVRHMFSERNGNLGESGCVNWMFTDRGILSISDEHVDDLEDLMEVALENGAVDFEDDDGVVTIQTEVADYMAMRDALEAAGYDEFMSDEITKLADNHIAPDLSTTQTNLALIEDLEDHDDIENVYHNLELSDEVADQLAAE